jgi:hypothetical protein
VGILEGETDKKADGEKLGDEVTFEVGPEVVNAEGIMVGAPDCEAVGIIVGMFEGKLDGVLLAKAVGNNVLPCPEVETGAAEG